MYLHLLLFFCNFYAIATVQVKTHETPRKTGLACEAPASYWTGPTYTNISYVERGTQYLKLDIWLPNCSAQGLFPAMLYAHPGNWNSLNKTLDHSQPLHLLSRGIALVSFDYRLVPEGDVYGQDIPTTWPAQGQDFEDAIRWLRTKGQSYSIDTKQIGCWGESAGGQMCAWLATTGSRDEDTRLNVAVSMFAPLCFLCGNRSADDVFGDYPADWLFGFPSGRLRELKKIESNSALVRFRSSQDATDLALVKSAEPFEQITQETSPMVIGHGTGDACVPFRKSQWMAAALEQFNIDHLLLEVPNGRHMYNDWANLDAVLDDAIEFVLKYMTPPDPTIAAERLEDSGSQPESRFPMTILVSLFVAGFWQRDDR